MTSREQFEAWVVGRQVCKKYGAKLNKDRAGSYLDYRVNDRWLAWEASREAIGVSIDLDEWPSSIALDIQRAIEAAGLKVKPC